MSPFGMTEKEKLFWFGEKTMTCPDKHIYKPQCAKDVPQVFTEKEGFCKVREDNLHCTCWWDSNDRPCCACGFNEDEKGDQNTGNNSRN